MWSSSINHGGKPGKKLRKGLAKLAVLHGTVPQNSKMASFHGKTKDEGELGSKGAFPHDKVIDDPKLQGGKAEYGRHVSRGGSVGKSESGVKMHHIDQNTGKPWPHGGDVKAGNPKTGNIRMRGPVARSGGLYGGGGRGTQ